MSIVLQCTPDSHSSRAVIDKIAKSHIRRSTDSNEGSQSQFQRYLEDNKSLVVKDCQVSGNQCTIVVQPLLSDALEELWKEYERGDLRVIAHASLVTPEILQDEDEAYLQVMIDEEEYKTCHLVLGSQGKKLNYGENRILANIGSWIWHSQPKRDDGSSRLF